MRLKLVLWALTVVALVAVPVGAQANPVSEGFADTFADPVIVRGDDGLWYAYGTTDPLREGERVFHRIPIARSSNLTDWTYVGDAFTAGQRPAFAAENTAFWAPDVRRIGGSAAEAASPHCNGKPACWLMYVTVTETTVAPGASAIGVATAPSPAGPWTFADEPVVAPRPSGDGGWLWTFDPAQLTTPDGRRFLYYGSYFGGIWVNELTPDGLRITGPATRVAIDNKFEGAYVVRRDGWYYLFASSANCCAGPTTGYSVSVGRSRDPRGPFVDRTGQSLNVSRAGGTPVIAPNGNRWVGTGHNGLITDLAGQDWLVYHAIDRADPYLDEPFGINERPMLLDRLDWIDGWPTVRAGAWASDRLLDRPVTRTPVQDDFATLSAQTWRIDGTFTADGRLRGQGTLTARRGVPGDLRAEADLRGPAGLTIDTLTVRPEQARLVVTDGRRTLGAAPLPAGYDPATWHHLTVDVREGRLTATLDDAVTVEARVPRADRRTVGVVADAGSEVDNVSAGRLYRPVPRAAAVPVPGRALPAYSDEFGDGELAPAWTFVRPDPAVAVRGGVLAWPLQAADLTGESNNAGVLLRDPPPGAWIAETRLTLDLGQDSVRNYQQAGLIAYAGDDLFARLSAVAIWNTRQIEFGYEIPHAGRTSFGGTIAGTPGLRTTWLRLAHRLDPATGEHEYRAGVSRDGTVWTWGGTWALPAGATPRIGMVAHGGSEPPVTAEFDYLRFSRW